MKLIVPDNRISSYALAEMSRAALIYGARMGWEVAALGTPLVVAGEAFSRGKGFPTDASTRDEYFRILETVRRPAAQPGVHPEEGEEVWLPLPPIAACSISR